MKKSSNLEKKKFVCSKCQNEFITTEASLKRRKHQCDDILCKNCYISYATKIAMKVCKASWIEKYGVDNPAKVQEFKDKAISKKKELYGERLEKISEKIKNTFNEKYGVNASSQVKEFRDKQKQTTLERYGNECYLHSEEGTQRTKHTMIKKYGVEFASQSEDISAKQIAKKREVYGDNLEKIVEKIQNTNLKKYGVKTFTQSDDYDHSRKIYLFNGVTFDSSWEMCLFAYLTDKNICFHYHPKGIHYVDGDKERTYFPDFEIEGKLFEVKGSHFIKDGKIWNPFTKSFDEAKTKCMNDNNVNIITGNDIKKYINYFTHKYGNLSSYKLINDTVALLQEEKKRCEQTQA